MVRYVTQVIYIKKLAFWCKLLVVRFAITGYKGFKRRADFTVFGTRQLNIHRKFAAMAYMCKTR